LLKKQAIAVKISSFITQTMNEYLAEGLLAIEPISVSPVIQITS